MRERPRDEPTSDDLPDWLSGGPDLPQWRRLGTDAQRYGFSAAETAWDRAGTDWSRANLGDQMRWRQLLAPEVHHRLTARWRCTRRPYGEPWPARDVDHDSDPTPEPEPPTPEPARPTLPPRAPVRRAPEPPPADPPSSGAYFIGSRF